jgi:hypothetical protein
VLFINHFVSISLLGGVDGGAGIIRVESARDFSGNFWKYTKDRFGKQYGEQARRLNEEPK